MNTTVLLALNRGLVSRLGLARVDIKRVSLSAETMTNWIPRVLGSMSVRPGLAYIGATLSNAAARFLKFIFATTDTALIELTDSALRIWINDTLLTRPSVSTSVANGTFNTNLTSWTDNDEAGATSAWASPGYMELVGTGTARAIRDQQVTVSGANVGVEHALRVVIARGPVYLRVGSTSGGDEYITEARLDTGTHSLSFTPTGDFHIRFFSSQIPRVWVDGCTVESSGVVTLSTPWTASDLDAVSYDQSGDVVYLACADTQQRKIERRGTRPNARSFSISLYAPPDGPFMVQNTGTTTIAPSALTGNITLTASKPLFRSGHVGALFSHTSIGQQVTVVGSATNDATASIRVTGIDAARSFTFIISGIAAASTVSLQRSYDNASWASIGGAYVWTADATGAYNDGLDNQIVYYRLILTNRIAPDSVTMTLSIGSGSVRGVARVTGFTSSTVVDAEVLIDMGGTAASDTWQEGQWSDLKGWPTAVRLAEGRLWWSGKNGLWGSVSDAYDSFDEEVPGDSGPINRTIGAGPVDTINWMLPLKRLVLGAQGGEVTVKTSSLEEPITPTNFALPTTSTQGSSAVNPVKVDQSGYFVSRSGVKVFELNFDLQSYDYQTKDLMAIVPELGAGGIVRMDAHRQPDTRVHCIRSDGVALVAVADRNEDVLAWVQVETDGAIEDVVTLPAEDGDIDDQVYYVVRRTINGSTVRYLEKWAQETECRGGSLSRLADSHITYTGSATTVISGLTHLEGEEVVVWAAGVDVGTVDSSATWTQTYTVSSGQIVLATAATNVCVGLGYTATFKSAKLGTTSQEMPNPLNRMKNAHHVGLVMADVHPRGVRFGPSSDVLDDMPLIERGTEIGTTMQTAYDEDTIEFPGTWTTDSRIVLRGQAPRPCTVLAVSIDMG
jgi:hypothetical protein